MDSQPAQSPPPEDRISKDTRRAREWRTIFEAAICLLIIINLLVTAIGVPLILKHFGEKADTTGQQLLEQGQEFLKQEAQNLAEDRKTLLSVVTGLKDDTHNALLPVGPAIEKVGNTAAKAGNTADETTKLLAFLRENNLKHLDDIELALLPVLDNIRQLTQKFGISVEALTAAFVRIEGSATAALAQMQKVFADDRIGKLFDELLKTSGNITAITDSLKGIFKNFEEASKLAPDIARIWKKIMDTGHKLQIPLAIAQFLGLIFPVLKPIFGIQ